MTKLWRCPKCKREFAKKNQAHSCISRPLDDHFKNKAYAKELFEYLKDKIETKVGPLKIEPLPCCIHLVSNYTFGAVWALKDKIRIDFRTNYLIKSKKIWKMIKMSANRYFYSAFAKNRGLLGLGWIGRPRVEFFSLQLDFSLKSKIIDKILGRIRGFLSLGASIF